MTKTPIGYENSSKSSPTIDFAWYVDGGVTLTIPQPREARAPTAKTLGLLTGLSLFLVIALVVPMPPWSFILSRLGKARSLLFNMPNGEAVVWMLPLLVPMTWVTVRFVNRRSLGRPTVVSITPQWFYVDRPGWFFRRRLKVSRERLGAIEIGRRHNDFAGERGAGVSRFVRIRVAGRVALLLCDGMPMSTLRLIVDTLNNAAEATSSRSAGTML
jgi:hypothetical protein